MGRNEHGPKKHGPRTARPNGLRARAWHGPMPCPCLGRTFGPWASTRHGTVFSLAHLRHDIGRRIHTVDLFLAIDLVLDGNPSIKLTLFSFSLIFLPLSRNSSVLSHAATGPLSCATALHGHSLHPLLACICIQGHSLHRSSSPPCMATTSFATSTVGAVRQRLWRALLGRHGGVHGEHGGSGAAAFATGTAAAARRRSRHGYDEAARRRSCSTAAAALSRRRSELLGSSLAATGWHGHGGLPCL